MDHPPDPYELLFTAKWNVPKAAEAIGLVPCEDSWEYVKREFELYCVENPPMGQYRFTLDWT